MKNVRVVPLPVAASAAARHAVAQARTASTHRSGAPAPAPSAAAPPPTSARVAVAAPTPAASSSATPRATTTQRIVARRTPAGRFVVGAGRWHSVRAGETLWSLATELLPPGASAAQIARQVARLVALNADRIDSPDLIRVGHRLRLR